MKESIKENGKAAISALKPYLASSEIKLSKAEKDAAARRKFRIISLHFPTDYHDQVLIDLMSLSQSFHLWFEREVDKSEQGKKGGLSLSFDSDEITKKAYLTLKETSKNGATKFKIQAPKWLEAAVKKDTTVATTTSSKQLATVTENILVKNDTLPIPALPINKKKIAQNDVKIAEISEPIRKVDVKESRKLFVCQLLPTTDEDLIYAVFGQENLVAVEIHADEKRKDGTKVAVLTFHTPELAEQSKEDYDRFVIDDGELSKPIRILNYSDYVNGQYPEAVEDESIVKSIDEEIIKQDVDVCDRSITPDNSSPSRQHTPGHEEPHKGKAGNLWSAQIVSNRSGDGAWDAIVKSINHEPENSRHANANAEEPRPSSGQHRRQGEFGADHLGAGATVASTEFTDDELSRLIDVHVEEQRVNWAELHSLHDLWQLVHAAVSPVAGWQAEETLKRSLMTSLQAALHLSDAHWWQGHLDYLIKLWQKELDQDSRSKVRKQIQLAAPEYVNTSSSIANGEVTANVATSTTHAAPTYEPLPPSPPPKRRPAVKKRALVELMGVGAFLANVQREEAERRESPALAPSSVKQREASPPPNVKRSRTAAEETDDEDEDDNSSSCESGEASSTSSSDGESSRAASPDPPPPPPPRDRSDRQRQDEYGSGVMPQFQAANPQNAWMPQAALPAMAQMMPAMMQMMQTRMAAPGGLASLGPQLQQQFGQLYQQIKSQMGNTSSAAPPSALSSQMMTQFMQLQQQQRLPGAQNLAPNMTNQVEAVRQMMASFQNQHAASKAHAYNPGTGGYHYNR